MPTLDQLSVRLLQRVFFDDEDLLVDLVDLLLESVQETLVVEQLRLQQRRLLHEVELPHGRLIDEANTGVTDAFVDLVI